MYHWGWTDEVGLRARAWLPIISAQASQGQRHNGLRMPPGCHGTGSTIGFADFHNTTKEEELSNLTLPGMASQALSLLKGLSPLSLLNKSKEEQLPDGTNDTNGT